jgi:MFS family permease
LSSKEILPPDSGPSLSAPKRSWKSTFSSLSNRNYRLFWLGSIASFFSSQMQQPAQNWLAYELTHSPLKLGLVMAMQTIPMVLLSLFSGVIIDRIQKKNILIIYQTFNALIGITIAVLIATGQIQYWHLLITSFLNGANMAFYMPARNAMIAEMVPRDKILNAVALNMLGTNVAQIAGPALSGILIAVIGTQGAYYVGIGFTVIAASIFLMLIPTGKILKSGNRSMSSNVSEGFRYVRIHNILLLFFAVEIVVTLFGMSYQGLMPVFAELLGQKSEGYGFMLAAAGVGSLIGSLFIASLGNFKKKGLILLITCTVFGIILILFASSSAIGNALGMGPSSAYLAAFWLVLIGISSTSFLNINNTLIQMNVNGEFRGRVNGVYGMVIGLYPVGMLLSGSIAEYVGAPLTVIIGGSVLTSFMIILAISSRRLRSQE